MTAQKRRLKDTLNDRKRPPRRVKKQKKTAVKIVITLVIASLGGVGLAKVLRIL